MEETDNYWENRRTIRRYADRDVPSELLDGLLLKASHAPTTGNMQLYSVIVTRDEDARQKLAPLHFNQPQVVSAPVVLTFCADFHRMSRWCEERAAEPCYDNLQSFVAAFIDTVAFAQQFNTLAELSGLGCCWLGTTTYNARQIAEVLELPELVVPVITLTVGYPAEDGVDVGRLPLEAVVHNGKYSDYTCERSCMRRKKHVRIRCVLSLRMGKGHLHRCLPTCVIRVQITSISLTCSLISCVLHGSSGAIGKY